MGRRASRAFVYRKSIVMHCGRNQPRHSYTLQNRPLTAIDITDLGITRTSDSIYSKHCEVVASKVQRYVAGAIRKIFLSRAPQLIWPAFKYYVLPIASILCVTYCFTLFSSTEFCPASKYRSHRACATPLHLVYSRIERSLLL